MNKIAVWNTAFLGDAILTLPLLQSLRLAYPDSSIDYYVRGGLSGLFKEHPAIDNVYEFDKRGWQKSLLAMAAYGKEIKRRGYDIWLSPHPSMRSAWLAGQSGAPVRVGYTKPWYNQLFYSKTVERLFPERHEVERILQLAHGIGLTEFSTWPRVVLGTDVRERADEYFARLKVKPVLGVHPGSVWATKHWPAKYFAEICRRALERGASVMLFAGPSERHIVQEIRDALGDLADSPGFVDTSNKLSLVELAAWLAKLDCYLGNDSGPLHLTWVQHVPTVAVFGPTSPSLGFIPLGADSVVMGVDTVPCRPCSAHGPQVCPRGHHDCMCKLLPTMVWPEVEKRLFTGTLGK